MPHGPFDPRTERKITKVRSRAIRSNVLTAATDWGVGGPERQQPRYMEGDEKRPPIPHPYRKYPDNVQPDDAPPVIASRRGDKHQRQT